MNNFSYRKGKCIKCGCSSDAHDWKIVRSVRTARGVVKKYRVYCKECRSRTCGTPIYDSPGGIPFEKVVEILNDESE